MSKRANFGAFVLGVSALAFSGPVLAQETTETETAGDDRRLGVVTVTAQRREESLIDVPVAVSAFSGEFLEEIGVADITEVAKASPNVTLEVSRGTNTTLTAFIRGVGQQDPVAGFEAGVGVYIDDVYLNRPQASVLDVYDVERIEVLRGPQGTLYGRNTIGGAVKYVTRGLSDEPYLKATGRVGSYTQLDGIVTASYPVTENFRIGGSVARLTRDGFGENLNNGLENYNKDLTAARLSTEIDLAPNFQIRASADYVKDDSEARQGFRLIPGQLTGAPVLDDEYDTRAGLDVVDQEVEALGGAIVAEWTLNDNWSVKNVLAYREDESTSPIDFDSLPSGDLDVPAIYENDQFSNELLVNYSGDFVNGVFGVYYLDANASTVFDVLLANTGDLIGLPGLNAQTFGEVGTETWAVFGDVTFSFTDQWSLTLGGRYTEDQRNSRVLRRTYVGGFSEFFNGSGAVIATTSDFNGSETYDDFTPRIVLSYKPTTNQTLYASFTEGFKGGSFDPRGQTSAAPDLNLDGTVSEEEIFDFMQFDPETVTSYELGWKAQWEGAYTSLAIFKNDYEDVQIPGSVGVDTNGDGVNDTFTGVTTNAADATLFGVELEGSAAIAADAFFSGDTLDLNFSVGYIDAEYNEYIDAFGNDVADERVFQNTPEWTGSYRFTYQNPVNFAGNGGTLTFSGGGSWRDRSSQFEVPNPFLDQGSYWLYDLSAVWSQDEGPWSVALHGKNLTDERYIVAGYNFVNINDDGSFTPTLGLEGTLTAFYGDPRTVTLAVTYEY
jgi:iron complex outermembrane recepter protein